MYMGKSPLLLHLTRNDMDSLPSLPWKILLGDLYHKHFKYNIDGNVIFSLTYPTIQIFVALLLCPYFSARFSCCTDVMIFS